MSKKRKLISVFILATLFGFLTQRYFSNNVMPDNELIIRAAIIPHHLVADSFMTDLGLKLKNQKPSQIVIIGPNHDEVGGHHFTSDPAILKKDHACYAPKGILSEILPKANVSCVLISSRITPVEIDNLVKILLNKLSATDVLVASVDFSHYQTLEVASINDLVTQKYLEVFNAESLSQFGNSHLDSPKTIATLFKYLSLASINRFSLINHSNSALILNDRSLPSTTSYFEYIYY